MSANDRQPPDKEVTGGRIETGPDADAGADMSARGVRQETLAVATRDTTDGVKRHAVKQYIETAWGRTDDGDLIRPETDTEVAEKLGVNQSTATRVLKNMQAHIIKHARVKAREYYEEHPDAPYREVARQVDASNATVTEWLKEDFDEGGDDSDDEQETLAVTARDKDEAEAAAEVTRQATDGQEAYNDLRHGVSWVLAEIDQDTLPETDPWPEVRRRIAAWRAERKGWRTGEIETSLEQFGGGGDDQ